MFIKGIDDRDEDMIREMVAYFSFDINSIETDRREFVGSPANEDISINEDIYLERLGYDLA